MSQFRMAALCGAVLLATSAAALAGVTTPVVVNGSVTPQADKYLYEYEISLLVAPTITTGEPNAFIAERMVRAFMLPLFDNGPDSVDPASLQAPTGWSASVIPTPIDWSYSVVEDPDSGSYGVDPSVFVDPPFVVLFESSDPLTYGLSEFGITSLSGFSFVSDYASANGPTIVLGNYDQIIDPPIVLGPGHPLFVPTPAALPAGLIGLGAMAMRRRRR